MGGINIKRLLLGIVLLIGIFGSTTVFQQDIAEKPPHLKTIFT